MLYVDKLDGKLTQAAYDRFNTEWRKEQEGILASIARHQTSNRTYVDSGVKLLELAAKARELYEKQASSERRRLLKYVLSNSTWKAGKLEPVFRKPFDLLVLANKAHHKEIASGSASKGEIFSPS